MGKRIITILAVSIITGMIYFGGCGKGLQSTSELKKAGKIETDKTIGLSNGRVSLAFDKQTGALKSLRNLDTGGEYFKSSEDKGNPFRAYINTTQTPSFVSKDEVQPDEGPLGGQIIDPAGCKLTKYSFAREGKTEILKLTSMQKETGLTFEVVVSLASDDIAAAFTMKVTNSGSKGVKLMAAFPYLSGLGLGKDPSTNLGVRLMEFGQSRGEAWKNSGDIYGRQWGSQWNAVYELSSDEALGLIVKDAKLINKGLRRHPGGVMDVFYFNNVELKQGESLSFPRTEILVYRGNWKETAIRYGDWFRSNFKLRKTPRWMDDVSMFVGAWIPAPKGAIYADRKSEDLPFKFDSFRDFPRLYLNPDNTWDFSGKYDVKEWAQYWEGVNRHKIYAAYQHSDGVYDFRKDLGGVDAFKDGVVKVEKVGRYVGLYVASMTVRNDSDFFKAPNPGFGTKPEDWMLMQTPDAKLPPPEKTGHQSFYMSPRNPAWQDYLAAKVKQLLKETGASYVRLDEFGSTFIVDYNPKWIKDPYNSTPEILEFLRKIRAAMDEVDPSTVLFTEGATDLIAQYVNGTLCMWAPGTDIAPTRLVIPEFLGFSYHLGQIDCALQGYVAPSEFACNRFGFWNPHHGVLWSPGLEKQPEGYPNPPESEIWGLFPEGKLLWHELVYTFAAAARGNDATLVNPAGIGVDKEKWAGRMWKSDKYWLMVCGSRWAAKPEQPIKVKLPEIPADIKMGYEFDTATLAMQEVPISREADGTYVMTHYGFSAVLLPRPECPALIQVTELQEFKKNEKPVIKLIEFAPWRKDKKAVKVEVSVGGLDVTPAKVELPASVTLAAPMGCETGFYKLKIDGNCLGVKRWIKVND